MPDALSVRDRGLRKQPVRRDPTNLSCKFCKYDSSRGRAAGGTPAKPEVISFVCRYHDRIREGNANLSIHFNRFGLAASAAEKRSPRPTRAPVGQSRPAGGDPFEGHVEIFRKMSRNFSNLRIVPLTGNAAGFDNCPKFHHL
jgi:hypothetical protein